MLAQFDKFIQLDRTFSDLALSEAEGRESELFRLMRREKRTQWSDLLKEPRVALLSEAGSGKTEEIRHIWRPTTDLLICEGALPWTPPTSVPEEDQVSDEAVTTTDDDSASKRRKSPFRIVALDDLAGEQVERFASAKGVTDIQAFKKAVERADAWSFTARPLGAMQVRGEAGA